MDVYLMQHGEAEPAEVDPDRPLSGVGRGNALVVADHAARCGVRIERIVHSGKLRAEQTAAILAEVLGSVRTDRVDGLKPNDPVEDAAIALVDRERPGSLAIVGHLPFLDRFAALLVTGDPAAHVVAFRNAGLVKLVPSGHVDAAPWGFVVAWAITPEIAGR